MIVVLPMSLETDYSVRGPSGFNKPDREELKSLYHWWTSNAESFGG